MQKDFDTWNQEKKFLNGTSFCDYVHEREVWWTSIGVNIGFEEDGKNDRFERPALVLKKFNREVVLIVPLTSKPKKNPYHVPFTHEDVEYAAIISQIRLISTRRLLRRMYVMDEAIFDIIRNSIKSML